MTKKIVSPGSALCLLLVALVVYASVTEAPAVYPKNFKEEYDYRDLESSPIRVVDTVDGDKIVVALWLNIDGTPTRFKYSGGEARAGLFRSAGQVSYYDFKGPDCPEIDVVLREELAFKTFMHPWPEE